ncbi:hypothetical protein BRD13_05525 [Halobacteriales archaeon SW_5_70_135]|nr:MAG: hypothetical protein BRD13_05525 [Halobacteriales archaeon SW_5_70_135]
MIVRVGGRRFEGDAVDLPDGDPERVARAVAGESAAGVEVEVDIEVEVEAPAPGPVTRRLSPVTPETSLSVGPALAAAARSRGHEAPQDAELARVRDELASIEVESVDVTPARRRLAEVGDREQRLQERVAELRGRLGAHRDREASPPSESEERLRAAVAELTEVRTERLAAEEAVERAERRGRRARDERERRLGLEDRRDNLRRAAREHLVDRVREPFVEALRAVPGVDPGPEPGADVDPRAVPDVDAALATARLAAVSAPLVVACGRFESAEAAAATLSAPVVRLPTG